MDQAHLIEAVEAVMRRLGGTARHCSKATAHSCTAANPDAADQNLCHREGVARRRRGPGAPAPPTAHLEVGPVLEPVGVRETKRLSCLVDRLSDNWYTGPTSSHGGTMEVEGLGGGRI